MAESKNKIWVYIDHFQGSALPASWEVLSAGLELAQNTGGGVSAIILGQSVEGVVQQAQAFGADEILLAEDASLADFRPEPYASLISSLAKGSQLEAILFPTTSRGRELAGMVGVDLDTGVLPDVIELTPGKDGLLATRPVYGGKLLAKVACLTRPQVITIRSRVYKKPQSQSAPAASVVRVPVELSEDQIATRVLEYSQPDSRVSLNDASVVVSGGRGIANNPRLQPPAGLDEKSAEIWRANQGFEMLTRLAEVLGAAVGASRAAVDAGYIPYAHQVGQTGKLISPDVYIACGISGAIQHLAGMRTSKVIVAINKDPDAPIFKLARFGVVGDLHEIIPALTEAFRKRLAQ